MLKCMYMCTVICASFIIVIAEEDSEKPDPSAKEFYEDGENDAQVCPYIKIIYLFSFSSHLLPL